MNIAEKIDLIMKEQVKMTITLVKLEKEVAHHIKRTDELQSKVQKVWYLVILGAGAGLAEYGPWIFKFIGAIQ